MFIKICGLTNEEDALLAVGMGADAVGFNFVPGSVRGVSVSQARDIARRLPGGVITVGVFANETPARVVEIMSEARLSTAQLHGDETPADCAWVAERVTRTFKAFKAGDPTLDRLSEYRASAIIMDGPQPGSGRVFDWAQLDGVSRGLPLILAGGLTPDNVASAISQVRPFGVDVASGVESAPGLKDPLLIRQFIANARAIALELGLDAEAAADGPGSGSSASGSPGSGNTGSGSSGSGNTASRQIYDWGNE